MRNECQHQSLNSKQYDELKAIRCTQTSFLSLTNIFSENCTNSDKCSHDRAQDLWLEAVDTDFPAIKCGQFELGKKCVATGVTTIMGPNMSRAHGVFYLETTSSAPFVIRDPESFKNVNQS